MFAAADDLHEPAALFIGRPPRPAGPGALAGGLAKPGRVAGGKWAWRLRRW
jgi:hypothetical protein